eukprot:m51a1_g1519 hypothetical protein (361) ;mRNA; r:431467-432798
MSSASSDATGPERTLTLSDGRLLAYAVGGDLTSARVVLTLHGVFGVGSVSAHVSRFFARMGWRCVAPTLPGWGRSSPFPRGLPVSAYAADVQELLAHEVGAPTHVLFFGGSYGSIWAYACAANSPPDPERRIQPAESVRGLLVLGGFSPFREHEGYTEGMTWLNYVTVGRPGQYWPLSALHPLVGRVLQRRLATGVPAALELLRTILTGPKAMTGDERDEVRAWAERCGTTFDEWEAEMAANMHLSVRETLEGYRDTPRVINADWGFELEDISIPGAGEERRETLKLRGGTDIPAVLPPVVIAGALRDHLAPIAMQRYVASRIPGAQFVELQGNHISGITSLLPMLQAIITGIETYRPVA